MSPIYKRYRRMTSQASQAAILVIVRQLKKRDYSLTQMFFTLTQNDKYGRFSVTSRRRYQRY